MAEIAQITLLTLIAGGYAWSEHGPEALDAMKVWFKAKSRNALRLFSTPQAVQLGGKLHLPGG